MGLAKEYYYYNCNNPYHNYNLYLFVEYAYNKFVEYNKKDFNMDNINKMMNKKYINICYNKKLKKDLHKVIIKILGNFYHCLYCDFIFSYNYDNEKKLYIYLKYQKNHCDDETEIHNDYTHVKINFKKIY
jgi:hypothetical protein